MHFNSEESPIVSKKFVESVIAKFGIDSDEYRVRVLGEFPRI
nr:MAG TPA: Terminase [Caudoviricetes sp.]